MFRKLSAIVIALLFVFSISLNALDVQAQAAVGTAPVTACPSNAAPATPPNFGYNGAATKEVTAKCVDPDKLVGTISNIANGLILVVAAISVIFIVYGAFLWMTKGQKEGQGMVTNAVIGLIIAVIAFFIVQLAVGAANQINSTKTL